MISPDLKFMLIAAFGALVQEFLYWWDLRKGLSAKKYKSTLQSKLYWALIVGMIFVSAIGTYILCYEDGIQSMQIPLILGASFPALFKKAVSATSSHDFGDDDGSNPSLETITRTYFGL